MELFLVTLANQDGEQRVLFLARESESIATEGEAAKYVNEVLAEGWFVQQVVPAARTVM